MTYKKLSRYIVLGILFFLPVIFLLFLYPATHNYTPLDIVNESVLDIDGFNQNNKDRIALKDRITVLGFFGSNPLKQTIAASNLKELIYDKFKGFKGFQTVILIPEGTSRTDVEKLKYEISSYEDIRFWHFVFVAPTDIKRVFFSLKSKLKLSPDFSTNQVFIIDKDLNQRGRLDDRTDREVEKDALIYDLTSYDCIEVSEIKNKMSEDIRILFTEYRQKRKGEFNSDTRRASDLKSDNNE